MSAAEIKMWHTIKLLRRKAIRFGFIFTPDSDASWLVDPWIESIVV
jgi:hypothetical protein